MQESPLSAIGESDVIWEDVIQNVGQGPGLGPVGCWDFHFHFPQDGEMRKLSYQTTFGGHKDGYFILWCNCTYTTWTSDKSWWLHTYDGNSSNKSIGHFLLFAIQSTTFDLQTLFLNSCCKQTHVHYKYPAC